MERVDKFFEKINGSFIIFFGLAFGIATIILSVVAYTSTGTSYSIFTHYISDLGAVSAPNNAYVVFNTGTIVGAFISPFITLFLFSFLRRKGTDKKLIVLWLMSDILSIIGSLLAGMFPEDTAYGMHLVGAFLVFFYGMMSKGLFGYAAIINLDISNRHGFPGFLAGTINTILMIVFLSNIDQSVVTFFEWMCLFSGWIFSLDIGIYALRTKY